MTTILSARDAARDLIYRYVERGDSLQRLREGGMGRFGHAYRAAIGGCMGKGEDIRCYSLDWIIVTEVAGQPCAERVHLPRLYAEIQHELAGGPVQKGLL